MMIGRWVLERRSFSFAAEPGGSSAIPEEGVRMGAFALTLYSLVSLIYTCILPPLLSVFGIKPIYMFSQGLFAVCMLGTNGASALSTWSNIDKQSKPSTTVPTTPAEILAVILVATCGISWATSMVVPFSLIGNYVNQGGDGGLILGIHNIFIVLPQIVTTLLSSLVFMAFTGCGGLQIVLTFAGLSAIISAVWIFLLKET
jgi:solute carrier family 45, member 1/2/4